MSALTAVILAGGRGTRFWPLSRRRLPKQCLAPGGGATLIQRTVSRLEPLVAPRHVLVITGPDMAPAIRAQLPGVPAENILVEPSGRNTAPCIGWAAALVADRFGDDAPLAVLPSDHVVVDAAGLRAALAAAADCAGQTGRLLTLGITPDRPETGYGYLEVGEAVWSGDALTVRAVTRFTEKPPLAEAQRYLAGGRHLWNAGMFVFTAGDMLAAFADHLPRSAAALSRLRAGATIDDIWSELEATSIDFGVMERASRIGTIPCDIGWSDVGAWDSAAALMPQVEGGNGVAEQVLAEQAEGCVVHAPEQTVALVGVRDLVVVSTKDALLVMSRAEGNRLRDVLRRLERDGLDHLT